MVDSSDDIEGRRGSAPVRPSRIAGVEKPYGYATVMEMSDELTPEEVEEEPELDMFGQPVVKDNRGGRPKGARNKSTRDLIEWIRASGQTPAQYLVGVMRDKNIEPKRRDAAAIALLPYTEQRLPQAVDLSAKGGVNLVIDLRDPAPVIDADAEEIEVVENQDVSEVEDAKV